jgi:hypothetical protein
MAAINIGLPTVEGVNWTTGLNPIWALIGGAIAIAIVVVIGISLFNAVTSFITYTNDSENRGAMKSLTNAGKNLLITIAGVFILIFLAQFLVPVFEKVFNINLPIKPF